MYGDLLLILKSQHGANWSNKQELNAGWMWAHIHPALDNVSRWVGIRFDFLWHCDAGVVNASGILRPEYILTK